MGLNYNLSAVFGDSFVNFVLHLLMHILKVPSELPISVYGRWSLLVVGKHKMAAQTLLVASLPSGNLERHELSSHYIDQWVTLEQKHCQ